MVKDLQEGVKALADDISLQSKLEENNIGDFAQSIISSLIDIQAGKEIGNLMSSKDEELNYLSAELYKEIDAFRRKLEEIE